MEGNLGQTQDFLDDLDVRESGADTGFFIDVMEGNQGRTKDFLDVPD